MSNFIAKALNAGTATVQWKSTIMLAAMRSASAGVVWAIVSLLTGYTDQFLLLLVFGTVIGLVCMVPLALISMAVSKIFPPAGLAGLIPQIYMVAGDPVLWIIEKFRPGTLPTADFKPINLNTVIVIFNPEVVEMAQQAKASAMSATSFLGRKAAEKIRSGKAPAGAPISRDVRPGAEASAEIQAQQKLFNEAEAEFNRLAAEGSSASALQSEVLKIKGLVNAGCSIFGPYRFLAERYLHEDPVGNFDRIMDTLEEGKSACSANRSSQDDIEVTYFALGKLYWDQGREYLAFKAYMAGLDTWREKGNSISQSSPLLPRIAFVASRMFSKNAMEKDNNTDLAVKFLDFCEASGVDMNLQISVSDARSA